MLKCELNQIPCIIFHDNAVKEILKEEVDCLIRNPKIKCMKSTHVGDMSKL